MIMAAAADYLTTDSQCHGSPILFYVLRAAGSVRIHSTYSITYYQGQVLSETEPSTASASGRMTD